LPNPLADTARWVAAQRARESTRPDRILNDPLASLLAGSEGMEMLRLSEQYNPRSEETTLYILVRIRFFDDWLLRVATGPRKQIVMVAAGLDTRPFHLQLPPGITFYELDQPTVLELKDNLLHQNGATPSSRKVSVPVDLKLDWSEPLQAVGFDRSIPSIWLLEGLLYYLEEPNVRQLLRRISDHAAPGSALGADLVSASFFRSPWTKKALEQMEERGMAWRFGSDDPEILLSEHGWRAHAIQPGEEPANYGRWKYSIIPREQRNVPRSFFVTAEKP
jgi:methyltransferase (TIGR00027 family)